MAQVGELQRAEAILRRAREAAGLAAYQYFFVEASPAARAAYESAMAAECEADALVNVLAGARRRGPPALK